MSLARDKREEDVKKRTRDFLLFSIEKLKCSLLRHDEFGYDDEVFDVAVDTRNSVIDVVFGRIPVNRRPRWPTLSQEDKAAILRLAADQLWTQCQ